MLESFILAGRKHADSTPRPVPGRGEAAPCKRPAARAWTLYMDMDMDMDMGGHLSLASALLLSYLLTQ